MGRFFNRVFNDTFRHFLPLHYYISFSIPVRECASSLSRGRGVRRRGTVSAWSPGWPGSPPPAGRCSDTCSPPAPSSSAVSQGRDEPRGSLSFASAPERRLCHNSFRRGSPLPRAYACLLLGHALCNQI